ncbi:hypothetical protein RU86_GL000550 [Lactococcus piscium]|uniref:Uncharacterized protein n=1 Tax=Pseudolactococcus piscium TaxID=1364 RepID=A0A2A5RX32_9LACT|nr:hypothetical protein [Lactococcus piscium]PCS05795.1 hypothetical protein RU86_GL000550 [Lactococcus piscium]
MFDVIGNVVNVIGLLSIIYSILQWLYFHKVKFYISLNKIFSFKKDVNFEISGFFNFYKDEQLATLFDETKKYYRNSIKKISQTKHKIVFQMDSMIVSIIHHDIKEIDEYEYEIFISVPNSSYKSALKNINILDRIFDDLNNRFRIEDKKFTFKSDYSKKNPFLNPGVTKIGVDKIKSFIMIISATSLEKTAFDDNDIRVGLDSMSYVDKNFSDIKVIAELILTM